MKWSSVLQEKFSAPMSIRQRYESIRLLIESGRPIVESWLLLLFFEFIMKFRSSKSLRKIVRNQAVCLLHSLDTSSSDKLAYAMNLACVFYFKRVQCLQRSAAITIQLRRYGWRAEMVTGAQIVPFEFHAWTEIDGVVVNDKPYMHEIYQVLERC